MKISSTHHSTHLPPTVPGEYHLVDSGALRAVRGSVTARAEVVHQALRETIQATTFPCVAAKASVNTSAYALGVYAGLGSLEATLGLAHDLERFTRDQDAMDSGFSTMMATFDTDEAMSEQEFERLLWAQLRALHLLDTAPYSPEVSPDPTDPRFGFSFAGRAFFVVGVHPHSSRLARRFPVPALIFNAHRQFQSLRDTGRFDRMQSTIRTRDLTLQGSLNPNLANHGEAPEARQYSGRAVEPGWVAPFPSAPAGGRCPFGHDTKGP